MISDIKQDTQARMQKSIVALQHEFQRMRTGRATPGILDGLTVDYYGTDTPLSQVANVAVADSRTLTVTPWEKTMVAAIEKAIINSDLGLNPASAGQIIRVPMPPLTEERRKDLIKVVKAEAENARVAVRNIRRDANQHIKDLLKEKEITEDELHSGEEAIQKLTDKFIKEIDTLLQSKEADLMEV